MCEKKERNARKREREVGASLKWKQESNLIWGVQVHLGILVTLKLPNSDLPIPAHVEITKKKIAADLPKTTQGNLDQTSKNSSQGANLGRVILGSKISTILVLD